MAAAKNPNRGALGRPSTIRRDLARQVVTRPGADPVTVEQRIVQLMEVGNYLECALRMVGLGKSTVYGWLEDATRAHAARAADGSLRWNAHQAECARFAAAYYEAEARGQAHLLAILEGECRGGYKAEVITEKFDGAGNLVERSTRTEVARPDTASIRWRLERRYPELWGRQRIEITGADGGPVEVTTDERARRIAEAMAGVRSATTSNGHAVSAN